MHEAGKASVKAKGKATSSKVEKKGKKSPKRAGAKSVKPSATLDMPMARLRRIMKDSGDVMLAQDSVMAVGKATVCGA